MTTPSETAIETAAIRHAVAAPSSAPRGGEAFPPWAPRPRRWPFALRLPLAAALVVGAIAWATGDPPLPQGPVLLTITLNHGVDLRDLYAAPLLVAATAALLPRRGFRRR